MKFKHIHFIINPASGKEEPILFYINRAFADNDIKWDISITKKYKSAGDIAKKLIGKTDLVAVYGGDGCVTAVASVLHGKDLPMAIIPGGTANVMAKELSIPLDTVAALTLLKNGNYEVKAIDMGKVNGHPFLLRVNLGIMADMVLQADRPLKDKIGQLAYGITGLKTVSNAESVNYKLKIDGVVVKEKGVSLTITNSGNIGIGDFAMYPGISISDGLLDVILLNDNNLLSILKVAGSTLLQNETEVLKHWPCREVEISMNAPQSFICDDYEKTAKKLKIKIIPGSIKMVVPAKK